MLRSPDQTEPKPATLESYGFKIANNLVTSLEFVSNFGKEKFWDNPAIKRYKSIAGIFTNIDAFLRGKYWKNIDEDPAIDGFLRGLRDKSRPPKLQSNNFLLTRYQRIIRNTFSMGRRTRITLWEKKNQLERLEDRTQLEAALSQIPNDQREAFTHLVSAAFFLRDIISDKVDYETILGFQKGLIEYLKSGLRA